MLNRVSNARRPRKGGRKSPLKIDPTRTIRLREAFRKELRSRFKRLGYEVYRLIVEEDAFGLENPPFSLNKFCPTGPGGGVDATCGKDEGGFGGGGAESVKVSWQKDSGDRRPVETVSISRLDGAHDAGHDPVASTRHAANLAKSIQKSGKVTALAVEQLPDGRYRVIDGKHRLQALRSLGITSIGVQVARPTGNNNCGGPGSGVPGPCPTAEPKGLLGRMAGRVSALADKIPGVSHVKAGMQKVMKGIHSKLEQRYGAKAATVIMTSGAIGGYAVAGAAFLATGVPGIPVVNDIVSIAIHTAVAEVGYQLGLVGNAEGSLIAVAVRMELRAEAARLAQENMESIAEALRDPTVAAEANLLLVEAKAQKLVANTRWRFASDPEKVRQFELWLRTQVQSNVLSDEALWRDYIAQGFERGAGRAFDDTWRARRFSPGQGDFYEGSREQFLRSSFGRPIARQRVEMLAQRTMTDLRGVTEVMATQMQRTLIDGLVRGANPLEIANDLIGRVDGIGLARAETIARTEIIRAHAEGQLTSLEDLGVTEVGVMVEWSTAGDELVCELCQPLEGVVLTIGEARGMLPRHPNCRCAWVPANVGEDEGAQTRGRGPIEAAFEESGLDVDVATRRPEAVV